MSANVLLIEDDKALSALLTELLMLDGYQIEAAFNGREGLEKALAGNWDAIILDIMLPEMDGLDVLRQLRPQCKSPVMMLTARGEELDRIIGFELGADDYLPKPFNPRELLARLKALLRRVKLDQEPGESPLSNNIKSGPLRISPESREARLANTIVPLTQAEFDLLLVLAQNAGKVMTKDYLYKAVLDRKITLYDRALDVHISNLRKKLTDTGMPYDAVKTIRGVGYLFVSAEADSGGSHDA